MSTPSDAFAAFVSTLADALDDHGVRGPDLAARAFLSRYHFDRLVRAAAGEPPQRLRRRVLLERAASRLASGQDRILDVALEAGYSSHEAFTRAFQRAYGRRPSDWRRAPGSIRISAPNGVHFHPPGRLRLPAEKEMSDMDLLLRLVDHHIWLVGEMVNRAERLTDSQLDTVIQLSVEGLDDEPTIRSQLSRLVGQMEMWSAAIDGEAYDFSVEKNERPDSMRRRLERAGPAFRAQVANAIEAGRLDDTFVDAVCEPPEVFSYGGMVAHVLTFAAHRRTLVLGGLAAAGITDLGSGDPAKWIAEAA
jgi:AraC family transcriptional regulator